MEDFGISDLPFGLTKFAVVRHNSNKIFTFGGMTQNGTTDHICVLELIGDLYKGYIFIFYNTFGKCKFLLTDGRGDWKISSMKLQTSRSDHIAFKISEDFFSDCNKGMFQIEI